MKNSLALPSKQMSVKRCSARRDPPDAGSRPFPPSLEARSASRLPSASIFDEKDDDMGYPLSACKGCAPEPEATGQRQEGGRRPVQGGPVNSKIGRAHV